MSVKSVTLTNKLTTGNKTEIVVGGGGTFKSLVITNTHSSAVNVSLWLTAQAAPEIANTDVTDTGTNINYGSGYAVTTSSQAVVVDGTAATSDIFLNEKVYKSNSRVIGTCTVFDDANNITFGGGIGEALVDDTSLYVGTIYHVLKAVTIPVATSLKLNSDEFSFNSLLYKLYAKSSNASGLIDIIIR
jgi:hypothetical protein